MERCKGIKDILGEYKKYQADIKDIEIKIQELEDIENLGPQAIDYAREKISQTFKFNSNTENEAIRIADAVTMLKVDKIHKESLVKKIDNAISTLDEIDQQIVRLRYIEDKRWFVITSIVHMSDTQCRTRGRNALKKLENMLCKTDERPTIF